MNVDLNAFYDNDNVVDSWLPPPHKYLRQKSAFLVKIIYIIIFTKIFKSCRKCLFFMLSHIYFCFPPKLAFSVKIIIYILSLPKYQEYGGEQLIFLSSLPGHWLLYRGEAPMGRPLPLSGWGRCWLEIKKILCYNLSNERRFKGEI